MSRGQMSSELMVGIDTGGTYTDAVLVTDEEVPRIVGSAKALTTHHDLAIGVGEAMAVITEAIDTTKITLVAVSTTLATNAIVEGRGGDVCLITMGFSATDLDRSGLPDAIGDGAVLTTPGGHNSHGDELVPIDLDDLDRQLDALAIERFSGFAVASQFAVRNARHEEEVRAHLRQRFGLGVTCSHELTAQLNGPKRAVTAVLNARLIGLIGELVEATKVSMTSCTIEAPLMVVRGDGNLISAELAAERPIETILSGPAASVVGARHLADTDKAGGANGATGKASAIVSDIGGTTTDLAVMTEGHVAIDPNGASVGGHDTMVEAIAIRTIGLGGDSEVAIDDSGAVTKLTLGPRRLVPLSLLAQQYPNVVLPTLEKQRRSATTPWLSGAFAILRHRPPDGSTATNIEGQIIDELSDGPRALRDLLPTKRHELTLNGLVRQGLVVRSGFTPTDAAHVLGLHTGFDEDAARAGADLLALTQDRRGAVVADSAEAVAETTIGELRARTVEAVLGIALHSDEFEAGAEHHPLTKAGLSSHRGHVAIDVRLDTLLIGLGASAPTYYPEVAERLGARVFLPEHAGVANAVGAIVGMIKIERSTTITRRKNGMYVVSGDAFDDLDKAAAAARQLLSEATLALAERAGATMPTLAVDRNDNTVNVNGQELFVDSTITVSATGRPGRR